MSLLKSYALPTEIMLKLLNGYMFTLLNKITNEFFIYKSVLVKGTTANGEVLIVARCQGTQRKFTLVCTIETKSLISVPEAYSELIFKKQLDLFNKLWYGLVYNSVPSNIELWHPCMCRRCNRRLTDPHSIERGIGPGCEKLEKNEGVIHLPLRAVSA